MSCSRVLGTAQFIFLLVCLLFAGRAYAGPACPEPIVIDQPDGKKFTAYVRGDEFQGWIEAASGYSVVQNDRTRYWEYAVKDKGGRIRPSGRVFNPLARPPSGITKHIKPDRDVQREQGFLPQMQSGSSSQSVFYAASAWNPVPATGVRNLLVILVEFNNRSLNTTPAAWGTSAFSTTPGVKSVANFYNDNSFGALTVTPVAHSQSGNPAGIVRVALSYNHPDYGSNPTYSAETMWINSALSAATSYVDFSSFDTNHDGIFQNSELVVYFVLAGYEASGTSKHPSIWAHSWGGSGVSAGGVALRAWGVNGELNNSSVQQPMGTMAHELGHEMCGLPDLYDTSNTNPGLGAFSVMASGSWGKAATDTYAGTTPVAFDAWSRQYCGWSSPRALLGGQGVSFGPALSSTSSTVKLMKSSLSTAQYFLAENRYPTGWDLGMEYWLGAGWGGGLLVLHIDENIGSPSSNNINRYVAGSHQGVMAEEADTSHGSIVNNTSMGSVYHLFWSGNNPAFTDATSPNSKFYDGTSTQFAVYNVSVRGQTMTADITSGTPPASSLTGPQEGATLRGHYASITGTAQDFSNTGLDSVDVSTDGGSTWHAAAGTTNWSYDWPLPATGAFVIKSRARDNTQAVEAPGGGVTVTVDNGGQPELTHYNWDTWVTDQGCALCHQQANTFLQAGYKDETSFCISCHNAGGPGHASAGNGFGHPVYVNVSTGWTKRPVYGSVTTSVNDNRPYAHLKGGSLVTCVTCHNPMNKYEDYGRQWELTTTTDDTTYSLQRGGWDYLGVMTPKVYRDTSLWGGPSGIKAREAYLADPAEYTYDESAGTVTFLTAQPSGTYVYVTLEYPYLRASSMDNRLCMDCHKEASHKGTNCLTCHEAHRSPNMKGIRGALRTTDRSERAVVFTSRTGAGSFADGGPVKDGICEVCHTTTKYYRRDGSGFANHSGGVNYDGRDCTVCHSHRTGFSVYS